MTFEEFVGQGWQDHGNDAAGVWARLDQGGPPADTPQRLFALAHLAAHVSGDHLGRWDDGIAFIERLTRLAPFDPATLEGKGLRRLQAVLHYCAGRRNIAEERLALAQPGGTLPPESTRIRMLAAAASALSQHDRLDEASAAFEEALALSAYGPDRDDPAARDLAVTGNNISCALEERVTLTPVQIRMMLRAAETGRRFWEIAGGWMQVERAEYRLALSHLKAGLPQPALRHAQECLRIVMENGPQAGELFFAHEAIAQVRLALGEPVAARIARDAAAAALPQIADEGFRSYCAAELAKLDAALASAPG